MSGVFHRDCACGLNLIAMCKSEVYRTDDQAVTAAFAHWMRRLKTDDNHRYWCVHGPSGHVIALHDVPDVPGGVLPPHP